MCLQFWNERKIVEFFMNSEVFIQQFAEKIPDSSGVYRFLGDAKEILYIGKATSLRERVRSYFAQDMLLIRGPKIVRMLELAEGIEWQTTDSALEALLLEASLVRVHRPPYNTDLKDDKSWNFVVITQEKFPRILIERGKKFETILGNSKEEVRVLGYRIKKIFGPFPSGGSLKEAVKIVRRIFPFRDRCTPLDDVKQKKEGESFARPTSHPRRKRIVGGCFNAQIGLCPGMCTGTVSTREYAKTIRNIVLFFEGRKTTLIRNLEREMRREAKALRFERANEVKKTLFALQHIQDIALLKRNLFDSDWETPLMEIGSFERIEAYDVAHLGGNGTVGVMTVVSGGEVKKNEYRKFILRGEANGNDLAALEELLERRLAHSEWTLPSLIVVDGGNLQRHVAEAVLKGSAFDIPIVSVVKDEHHKPKGFLGPKKERDLFKNDILLANSEAHRFAISFHRKRRGKAFLNA